VVSTYRSIGAVAAQMGCGVEEVVASASAPGEDLPLEEALGRVGDVPVVFLYGLEEVLYMYGVEWGIVCSGLRTQHFTGVRRGGHI
jgi:RecA-superfamily ATPases implicated in signal transduction